MSERFERYSAQTRQTRTALLISASTFFLYIFFKTAGEQTTAKVPPLFFEVSAHAIGPILLIVTFYFYVSYVLGANKDREVGSFYSDIDPVIQFVDSLKTNSETYIRSIERHRQEVSEFYRRISERPFEEINALLAPLIPNATEEQATLLRDIIQLRENGEKNPGETFPSSTLTLSQISWTTREIRSSRARLGSDRFANSSGSADARKTIGGTS